MENMLAYIDVNDDCTDGVPVLSANDLRNPLVNLASIGKNLNVIKFDMKETKSFGDIGGFVDYLDRNKDILEIFYDKTSGQKLYVYDYDILYNPYVGFVELPWTKENIKEKCAEIKDNVLFKDKLAYKYEENGVKLYNLSNISERRAYEDGLYKDDSTLRKGALIHLAQNLHNSGTKFTDCIIGVDYKQGTDEIFLSMPHKNYLDTINLVKEIYEEITGNPLSVRMEDEQDFGKDQLTIYNIHNSNLMRLDVEEDLYTDFAVKLIDEINNPEYKIAEDILTSLSTYKDENIEIYETNKAIGVTNDSIIDTIKERDNTPEVILIYDTDEVIYSLPRGIAINLMLVTKDDDGNYQKNDGIILKENQNDFSCEYIDSAEIWKKERLEREKEKEESKSKEPFNPEIGF